MTSQFTPHDYAAETASVAQGLDDARATLAEIWRRSCGVDDGGVHKARCMAALKAVIAAEQTMRAAEAFLLAKTRKDRAETFKALRVSCCLRLGHDTRKTP